MVAGGLFPEVAYLRCEPLDLRMPSVYVVLLVHSVAYSWFIISLWPPNHLPEKPSKP